VIAHAESELKYAAREGKKVFVGLETGDLPDETILGFGTVGGGSRLMMETSDGTRVRLRWLRDEDGKNAAADDGPVPGRVILYQVSSVAVPASKLTFAGKRPAELEEIMLQTASEIRRFPSFHGFAIHSYESYRRWLER